MLQVAERFKPENGNKFSTYAHNFICGRIYRVNPEGSLKASGAFGEDLDVLNISDENNTGAMFWVSRVNQALSLVVTVHPRGCS